MTHPRLMKDRISPILQRRQTDNPLLSLRPTRRPLSLAISALLLSGTMSAAAQAGGDGFDLAGLNGANGLRLDGELASNAGTSVSAAGDVNGDGIDDLIIGASGAAPNGPLSGSAYVVFGRRSGFPDILALGDLDGSNGFRLDGASGERVGGAVSVAGDIDGDGIDDLIIGAYGADRTAIDSGSSYVVFGRSSGFPASVALTDLDGSDGFRIDGVAASDYSGTSVSAAGDINDDGVDDLIIGANGASPNGGFSGSSFVVFGRTSGFPASLALADLDGSDGFRLDGVAQGDLSGSSVSGAGDINGDGIDDLSIGAFAADNNGDYSGSSYVVFGKASGFAPVIALANLDGGDGFRLDGVAERDYSGVSVSAAGDINGDGIDDLIIGAFGGGRSDVVFGRTSGFPAIVALSDLDGSDGFRLGGALPGDQSGASVSGAGDIDGDGIDDVIIGAPRAGQNGLTPGSSHVVFGRASGFPASVALADLERGEGFRMDGLDDFDASGSSVSGAGDVNGDGVDDFITAAPSASAGSSQSGSSYVVFGVRDRLFNDRFDGQNIQSFFPRLDGRQSFLGSSVRWDNGSTCNCDFAPFDFNLYRIGDNLAFFWPRPTMDGGVADESGYLVLQPGDVVGPESNFSASLSSDDTANWRAGADGYLGFRYIDPASGRLRYGYARLRTTAPTGYPAELVEFNVNLSGAAVTIPSP